MAIISKLYCYSSPTTLVIRRRPLVVSGGGFVVTDCSQDQTIIFKVDGCGIVGTKGELIVRDCNGEPLVLIRRKGGMVEALSFNRKMRGYAFDYQGSQKLVFTVTEPKSSCFVRDHVIKISTANAWDFEVKGYFPDRDCAIVDSGGRTVAQIGVKKEVEELMLSSKDLYHVVIKAGVDQAFVVGVIATLDYIYAESTRC